MQQVGGFLGYAVKQNRQFWQETFWQAWDTTPLDEKLVWLFFLSQTLSLITLIEVLILG